MINKAILQKKTQKRRHNDLVGIDFATSATKVVRLKQSGDEISLIGIDMLPAVDFGVASTRIELPRNMLSYYSCLCYSCPEAVVRMVNTPLAEESSTLPDSKIRELLNVTEDYRPSATLINRGKGRQDSSFLAAAIPVDDVGFMLNMFPAGPPAPASLEVSGLAVISAFLNARGKECAEEAGRDATVRGAGVTHTRERLFDLVDHQHTRRHGVGDLQSLPDIGLGLSD